MRASRDRAWSDRHTIEDLLECPHTGAAVRWSAGAYVSEGDPSLVFPVEEGIVRAYVPHEPIAGDVTDVIRRFYEAHPFPDYEETDGIGSLIEKSVARGFPELLNRSIPPRATVLEVGCGTGQLGNFLSIAARRLLSVDLCLPSLRLAEAFRVRNGLPGVTFAQMNLFRLPLRPERFDVVICTGVLHHTADPRRGFEGLLRHLRPGGHVVIGLYNRFGRLQTRLRAGLLRMVGERALAHDPYLRDYGVKKQKRRAWVEDQYRNPHESIHTMDEVLGWFDATGIEFIRALPGTVFQSRFSPDYRRSLFEPEARGSYLDRLLSQTYQMLTDTEGGLFIMIGRKRDHR
jgi:SAM-dependent methyltransferase